MPSAWKYCGTQFLIYGVLLSSPTPNIQVGDRAHLFRGDSSKAWSYLDLGTATKKPAHFRVRGYGPDPPQAISLFADALPFRIVNRLLNFGMKHRAPVISGWEVFARSGAICSYGPKLSESYRRLAYYVDRVLKGTPPSELPIERPTKFETVVNLKTARALSLNIPDSVMRLPTS